MAAVCSATRSAAAGTVSTGAVRHPISVTETDVFVTRTRALVRIQIFAEDLLLFQGLEPNAQDVIAADDLRQGLERHRAFLLEKVVLRDAAGEPLAGTVTDLKPFEIPADGIPVSDLMLHTATYQLEYPFATPPEFLTLQQDISDENFIFPSEMKVAVHQSGSELTFTESLKAGASVTLRFDWNTAPLADNASDEDWEKWFEKQREATLGITSYSSIYSFIYIEPAEVRHEILIPLASLKTVLPLQHRDPSFVEIDEQDAVRELIRGWLKDVNPVLINGQRITPEFTRIDFYSLDLKDFAGKAEPRRVSLASGRAGIILTYRSSDAVVRDAQITWDKFHSTIRRIQSVVFAYPDRTDKFEFSRFNRAEQNRLVWTCPDDALPQPVRAVEAIVPDKPTLALPLVSLAVLLLAVAVAARRSADAVVRLPVAAGLLLAALLLHNVAVATIPHPWQAPEELSPEQSVEVFRQLHAGTYRALDFGSEDRIYDTLQTTVDGPLLEELFLQLRQSLEIREQGGAVARVRAIDYADCERLPRQPLQPDWPGFACRGRWTVAGTVEHWGHVHERRNQFEAVFFVEPRDSQWKITRMEIEEQRQLSQKTSLRKF